MMCDCEACRIVTDHAVVRYFEATEGVSSHDLKTHIFDNDIKAAADAGVKRLKRGDIMFAFGHGRLKTILGGKRRSRDTSKKKLKKARKKYHGRSD